ncbi:MAG TPA: hypothetical protein VFY94_09365, partial [Rhodanobacteraceae bacterium]|nr:hypothetical protein [Rhodanobacteraceae bacterium]
LENRVTVGKPLDLDGFVVTGIGTRSELKLPGYELKNPAFERYVDIVDGKLAERAGHASGAGPVGHGAQP